MKLLSLDTSFSFINLSVIEGGKIRLVKYIDNDRKTLENLPSILNQEGLRPEEFDAFAVSKGVGYLTSLRIGITFMKTIAYLNDKPIVSYENLNLLAIYTPLEMPIYPFLKVSRNIFYREVSSEGISDIKLLKENQTLKGLGVSLSIFKDIKPTPSAFYYEVFPFSAYGGLWAYNQLLSNPEGEDPFLIEPVYLKPPV